MKVLSNIIRMSKSTSQLRITKLTRNMKESTFTNILHNLPTDFFTAQSCFHNLVEVGLRDPNPKSLYRPSGIKLILSPKSHIAHAKLKDTIVQGIVKSLGSSFLTKELEAMALWWYILSMCTKLINYFLATKSFMNFTYS